MEIKPLISPMTNKPYKNHEICDMMLDIYDKSIEDYNENPDGEYVSPLGGVCDNEIIKFCKHVAEGKDSYEKERRFVNGLSGKEQLLASAKQALAPTKKKLFGGKR